MDELPQFKTMIFIIRLIEGVINYLITAQVMVWSTGFPLS